MNKGTLLGEGSPKEMIDAYKRVLVGQYEVPDKQENNDLLQDPELRKATELYRREGKAGDAEATTQEKDFNTQGKNPSTLEYGTKQAKITEYYVTDDRGIKTTAVIKGGEFTLHMRVKFAEHIPAPIFAFSLKNAIGTEITGTNSMIEKAFLESGEPGQIKDVTFTQRMNLQGGEYLISMGVTGYNGDTFEVYHRLYDALNITVVSDKDTVGYYDMESAVTVTDAR